MGRGSLYPNSWEEVRTFWRKVFQFKLLCLGLEPSRSNHLHRATVGTARAIQWDFRQLSNDFQHMKENMKTTMKGLNKVDDIGGPLLGM